jgi:hypothetical protein
MGNSGIRETIHRWLALAQHRGAGNGEKATREILRRGDVQGFAQDFTYRS